MNKTTHIEFDHEAANALLQCLGALVFATVRRLTPEQRQAFAADLETMAAAAAADGNTTTQTLLQDLIAAAQMTP